MSNPSTSGTAYLLLASHAARLGEDKMWQYYEALDRNLSQVTKSGGAPGRMAASGETPIGIALAYEVEVAKKQGRSEEHTSELQSLAYLVCRLLLEKKKI